MGHSGDPLPTRVGFVAGARLSSESRLSVICHQIDTTLKL
jgi:hypothetical protein